MDILVKNGMGLTEVNQCELESNITLAKVFSPIIIGNDFLRLKTLKNHAFSEYLRQWVALKRAEYQMSYEMTYCFRKSS